MSASGTIAGSMITISTRLRYVIISLAKWTARPTAGQPRVQTSSMESMTTGQTTHVVVFLEAI
jgi:hypothetical protein